MVTDELRQRIADALGGEARGWTVEATKSLSLPALRDLVRTKSEKLHAELSGIISRGEHILGERRT